MRLIRQEDVTKIPVKWQPVKELHHTERPDCRDGGGVWVGRSLPTSKQDDDKEDCLELSSEFTRKSLWKIYNLDPSLRELRTSHIYLILLHGPEIPQIP